MAKEKSHKSAAEYVAKALRQHGFPLEMEVTDTLFDRGFDITNSEKYVDEESNKDREIDIIATRSVAFKPINLTVYVKLIIECKHSSVPWTLLCAHKKHGFAAIFSRFAFPYYFQSHKEDLKTWANRHIKQERVAPDDSIGYNLVQVNEKPQGGDHAYEAVMSVIKATNYFIKYNNIYFANKMNSVTIFIPMIVISGSLTGCSYEDGLIVKEIPTGILKSNTRRIADLQSVIIITTKDAVSAVVDKILKSLQDDMQNVEKEPKKYMLQEEPIFIRTEK